MASVRTATIGQGSANYVIPHAILQVKSVVNYGDATSGGTTNVDPVPAQLVPWGFTATTNYRQLPLWHIDLATLPAQIQGARSLFKLGLVYRQLTVIPASITVALHEMEGVLAAGTAHDLRATAIPWYGSGEGPAPGFDYDAEPIGSVVLDSAALTALPVSNLAVVARYVDIDITDALQRARDARRNLDLIMPVTFAAQGASIEVLYFDYPALSTFSAKPHTYVSNQYWPALGVLSAAEGLAGRPADFTKLHDPVAAGTNNRTWLDAIEDGTTGSPKKEWAWNFRKSGIRRDVIVGTAKSESTNVNNSGAAGSRTLRAVRVYDWNGTNEGTDTGDYVIEPQSGTTYKVAFTDVAGTTVYLNDSVSGVPTVTFSADHTFKNAAGTKTVLTIYTARFSVTTGWLTTDRVRWSVRGDQRTTQSVDTPTLVEIMPPTIALGDTGSTSRARKVSGAYTQQGWAAAANVTISAVSRGHLTVRDTAHTAWTPGGCVTVFTTGGVFVSEDMTISQIDPPGYTDVLRMNRDFTAEELAAFNNASWHVTGGVYIGTLAAFQVRQLAAAVAAGDGTLTLNSGFDGGTPGDIWLVDTSTGANETIGVDSGLVDIDLTGVTGNDYTEGSLVFLVVDPDDTAGLAGRPYFVEGAIPSGQDEGLYGGFYEEFEERTV